MKYSGTDYVSTPKLLRRDVFISIYNTEWVVGLEFLYPLWISTFSPVTVSQWNQTKNNSEHVWRWRDQMIKSARWDRCTRDLLWCQFWASDTKKKKKKHVVRMNHIWNYCILSFCTHARRHVCPHSDVLLNLTVAAILSRVHTSTVFCGCTIFSCLWLSRWQWFVLISASTKQCLFFSSLPFFSGQACVFINILAEPVQTLWRR